MVRIKRPRTTSRAATVSLLVAAGAAVFLLAVWRFWQSEEEVHAYRRTLTDVELKWKCDAGHTFRAAGQIGAKACWTCGKPAYPVARYVCPEHGAYECAVRFVAREDGTAKVSQLRMPGRDWVAVEEGVYCPRCGRQLVPQREDPLEDLGRKQKKGGG